MVNLLYSSYGILEIVFKILLSTKQCKTEQIDQVYATETLKEENWVKFTAQYFPSLHFFTSCVIK